jgi:glucose uptake protein GlcU
MKRTRHSMLRTALQLLPFMLWSSVTALGAERSSRPTEHVFFALGVTALIFVIVVLLLATGCIPTRTSSRRGSS